MNNKIRIDTALGKILRNYNYLELNLGLCLRFLENPRDPNKSHKFLARSGMPEVINRLMKLLKKCEHITDTTDFQQWMKRSEEIRNLRNFYVHTILNYLPLRDEVFLELTIPPWRKESISNSHHGRMRIEDLESHADRIEEAIKEFMAIRQKYKI